MKYDINDVKDGFYAGMQTISPEGIKPSDSLREDAMNKLTKVLDIWPYEFNRRFVRNFAEAVLVAEASRETFKEPQLDEQSIVAYLGHSVSFFNSWTHL